MRLSTKRERAMLINVVIKKELIATKITVLGVITMPLTFAHPAAVLPFSRSSKYINFSALVLGSMAPDFEYFLRGRPSAEIGHTLIGFLTFNLPIVVLVYFIYHTWIHKTLWSHLPSFLQESPVQKPRSSKVLHIVVLLYSALFGMITHVVWDSFTHLNGFMVRKLSILTYTAQVLDFNIPIFKLLQHGSTIVGILIIISYMYIRARKNRFNDKGLIKPKQKWMYWSLIALVALLLFSLWYFIDQVSIGSYGIIVVRIIDCGFISLLIVSLLFGQFNKVKKEDSFLYQSF